jgi:hypothetical protein
VYPGRGWGWDRVKGYTIKPEKFNFLKALTKVWINQIFAKTKQPRAWSCQEKYHEKFSEFLSDF